MNNHAYQYMCAGRSTGPLGLDQECMQEEPPRQYTYGFEEFENRALFKRILKNILCPGPYSTMAAIIDMRALDVDPRTYIGVHSIALQAAKSERQVERDLKTLEDMELLRTYPDMAPVKGTMRAVMRKDFSGLYTFAYEYLLWENSTEFAMYPPKRKFAELVRKDHGLYKKLVRFENYRLVLETKKNKFKKEDKDTVRGEAKNNRQLLHVSSSTVSSLSSYETHNSNYLDSLDSNLTQDLNVIQEDSPFTRSSGGEYPQSERGTHEGETTGGRKGSESFEIPQPPQGNISSRETNISSQRNVPRDAKELTAQQKGKALIEAVLNEEDRKAHTPKHERRERYIESKALQERCKGVVNVMRDIAHELNDQGGKSTDTRISKLFERSQMPEDKFIELMYYARGKVKSIPQDQIKVRGMDGKANRVPLLMSIVGQTIEKGMEAMLQADAEFEASREERRAEHERREQAAQELDARNQALAETENDPQVQDMLYKAAVQSSAMQDEIEAQCEAVEPEPAAQRRNVFSRDRVKWEACQIQNDYLEIARQQIREVTGVMTKFGSECSCGCKIKSTVSFKQYCVKCSKPTVWPEELCTQVNEILANVPTLEICEEEAIMQIEAQGYEIA